MIKLYNKENNSNQINQIFLTDIQFSEYDTFKVIKYNFEWHIIQLKSETLSLLSTFYLALLFL